mmetsp:Transcript_41769/g.91103  ORF Transcript_41769/g.91103 Transcript_41769/m.91103 type:complete len:285 (+) Transcript_41769:785-1639(+)
MVRWLIEEKHVWTAAQGGSQRKAHPPAARECRDRPLHHLRIEVQSAQGFSRPVFGAVCLDGLQALLNVYVALSLLVRSSKGLDFLELRCAGQGCLDGVALCQQGFPLVVSVHHGLESSEGAINGRKLLRQVGIAKVARHPWQGACRQSPQQRRLARAVLAHKAINVACLEMKTGILEDVRRPIGARDAQGDILEVNVLVPKALSLTSSGTASYLLRLAGRRVTAEAPTRLLKTERRHLTQVIWRWGNCRGSLCGRSSSYSSGLLASTTVLRRNRLRLLFSRAGF